LLCDCLGVVPGALSPLALINDGDRAVELVIDDSLRNVPLMLFHPLVNTSTIALARDGWDRFLRAIGCEPTYVEVDGT
jgi:Ala-tRNA(Pro) deacylase